MEWKLPGSSDFECAMLFCNDLLAIWDALPRSQFPLDAAIRDFARRHHARNCAAIQSFCDFSGLFLWEEVVREKVEFSERFAGDSVDQCTEESVQITLTCLKRMAEGGQHKRAILKFSIEDPVQLVEETRELWLQWVDELVRSCCSMRAEFLQENGPSARELLASFDSLRAGVGLLCATAGLEELDVYSRGLSHVLLVAEEHPCWSGVLDEVRRELIGKRGIC